MEYKGAYYSLIPNRFSYEIDKIKNENCLILTMFAIAKEMKARVMKGNPEFDWNKSFGGFVGKDVVVAVGLSPAHFEKQREAFKQYFMDAARYGLDFNYNGKTFSFHIKEVYVFPQDYAAAIIYKQALIKKYSTVYCFVPTVFCGGSKLLAPFLETTGMFGKTEYIEDIHTNAVGYQEIAKLYLNG